MISWNTRCGLIGMVSKSVRRSMVRLRSLTAAVQASRRSRLRPRASAISASSASPASETMLRSGQNTRPIWVGSMSIWMKLRPLV